MSWMQKLYETYELNQDEIGVQRGNCTPLYPVYHMTQQAQIEAVIDIEGNWCPGRSSVISAKADMTTIIPTTEKSASRTSTPEPHPLFDKLQYIAGDYLPYGQSKRYDYPAYLESLSAWCASPYGHPSVRAVETYLKKACLIKDLADDGILYRAEDGSIPENWQGSKKDTPPIFKVCSNQLEAFVRFRVLGSAEDERLWENPAVWESWIAYVDNDPGERDLCYVMGRTMPVSELSPKKIRNAGDNAKLISRNDTKGFTFRGRFDTAREAACVGRETTEKAHSALRWLISRQAYINGDQVVLAWSPKVALPEKCLALDTLDLSGSLENCIGGDTAVISNLEDFSDRFRKALAGYKGKLDGGADASVIGLDSATPGRLSIFYYRELQADDLLERIGAWHTSCAWLHRYRFKPNGVDAKGKPKYIPDPFIGAPSPADIVIAAYGRNVDDKLKKSAIERLLPCIIDKARLPRDIMLCAVRRAANSIALDPLEASRTASIACALVRKYYNQKKTEEEWNVGLDYNQRNRNYLFGRALAYARKLEELAQWVSGNELRQTNAERMQVAFTQHPAYVWAELYKRLLPYLARLRGANHHGPTRYETELNEVISYIRPEDFEEDKALTPLYLLGYQSQLNAFQEAVNANKEAKDSKGVKNNEQSNEEN